MKINDDINLPADFDDLSKHAPLLDSLRAKGDGFAVPENYFSESAELLNSKINLPPADGFVVPENYFEDSAEKIISICRLYDLKARPFEVPPGYFEELTAQIESIIALNDSTDKNSFTVPENYFSELDSTIKTKIALDNLKQDEGFAVPENYFDKFTAKIESRIAVDDLKNGSDADVPPGYFDTLADKIAARIAEGNPSTLRQAQGSESKDEVIERGRIIVFAEVLKRYAKPVSIAAGLALILGVSIWFFTHSNNQPVKDNFAANPAKTNAIPVIPAPKKDSAIIPQEQPKQIAMKKPKIKKGPEVNHPQEPVVKEIDKKDLLEQLDLIDENTIADYVNETKPEVNEPVQDESLKNEMLNYLDPTDIK